MGKLVFILVLSILYFFSLFIFIKKENNKAIICVYNIILFSFLLIFSILFPMNYYLSIKGYNVDLYIPYYEEYSYLELFLYYIAIFFVSHIILFISRKSEILISPFKNNNVTKNGDNKKIFVIAIIMLIIGFVSNYLYLRVYGGYRNYLNYSGMIRSGVIVIDNPFSFLIAFRNFGIFSSYIFLSLIYSNKTKLLNYILFIISFIFSILILYSNKGRISFVIYILILLIYVLWRKKEYKYIDIKIFVRLGIIGIICLIAIVNVGKLLNRNTSDNLLIQLNKEFSFIFLNFKVILNNINFSDFRFFKDLILFPIYLLPSSFWYGKLGILKASDINTIFWFGSMKGIGNVYGEMPVDLISIAYMQSGFFGIIILPIFYLLLLKSVIKKIYTIFNVETEKIIYVYIIFTLCVETIIYADPYHIITSCFSFIAFMIFIFLFNKIKLK